jgi:hypothetical protein
MGPEFDSKITHDFRFVTLAPWAGLLSAGHHSREGGGRVKRGVGDGKNPD